MSTTIFPFAQWLEGTTQPRIPFNDNSLRMEILSKAAIAIESTEPGFPTNGDCYILGGSPSGAQWGSFAEGNVVVYYAGTWYAFEPFIGWLKYNNDDSKIYLYDGGWGELAVGGGGSDRRSATVVSSASGVVTLDYSAGDYFTLSLTENVTSWVISNPPPAGKGFTLMIQISQDSTPRTVAKPGTTAGGAALAVSTGAGDIDIVAISSFDAGTTLRSSIAKDFS